MDVAFLSEVEGERAFLVISGVLKVTNDVAEERKGCEDANLFPIDV